MTVQALLFGGGLVLLLLGGDALIRGASTLAARLGVPELVVGLTVVAFGTSAPELVVSLLSSLRGDDGISLGNVVGSNIANLGLLLGATACLRPLVVHSTLVTREIPLLVLVTAMAGLLALDGLFDGGAVDRISRGDGLVLLLMFAVFLYLMVGDVRRARAQDALLVELPEAPLPVGAPRPRSIGVELLLLVMGLGGLAAGGHVVVGAARELALGFGVPSVVVGTTIVAVGTSLPELATSLMAARRGQADLAVGNLVGSNLFNLLFVLGAASVIAPVTLPPGSLIDLATMLAFAAVTLPMALTHGRRVTRGEGALLLLGYALYVGWQLVRGP